MQVGAFTTAENGFKKYSTSRPVPSAESIKRWKEMPGGMSTLGPHPWFGKVARTICELLFTDNEARTESVSNCFVN